jgi:hypothetical protein
MPSRPFGQIVPLRGLCLFHDPLQPLNSLRRSHGQTFTRIVVCNCEADEIKRFMFRAFDDMERTNMCLVRYALDRPMLSVEIVFFRADFVLYAVFNEPFQGDCITKDAARDTAALGLDGNGCRWC